MKNILGNVFTRIKNNHQDEQIHMHILDNGLGLACINDMFIVADYENDMYSLYRVDGSFIGKRYFNDYGM